MSCGEVKGLPRTGPRPTGRFSVQVTPTAVIWAIGLLIGVLFGRADLPWVVPVGMALAAVLHEMGHMAAALLCCVRLSGIRLDLYGARLGLPGLISYRQELLIAAGGPAANLLTVGLLFPAWRLLGSPLYGVGELWPGTAGFLSVLIPASLGLCVINILPVATLDGGRILYCLLAQLCGDRAAHLVQRSCTGTLLGGMWLLSVYALLRAGQQLSLFVFSFTLLVRCLDEDRIRHTKK